MLSIRLMRTGKAHQPHYRIVVQEKRSKLTGKAIDQIGHYHPADKGKQIIVDQDKARKWLAAGAQPSDTVANIFVKQGLLTEESKVTHFFTHAPKAEVQEEAPVAEVTPEETTEAPAEEVVAEPAEETAE